MYCRNQKRFLGSHLFFQIKVMWYLVLTRAWNWKLASFGFWVVVCCVLQTLSCALQCHPVHLQSSWKMEESLQIKDTFPLELQDCNRWYQTFLYVWFSQWVSFWKSMVGSENLNWKSLEPHLCSLSAILFHWHSQIYLAFNPNLFRFFLLSISHCLRFNPSSRSSTRSGLSSWH